MAEKIPYLRNAFKSSFAIVKAWKYFEGEQGCTPVVLDGICLRFDQSPPDLPQPAKADNQPAAKPVTPVAKTVEPAVQKPKPVDPVVSLLAWAIAPPAAPPAQSEKKESAEEVASTKKVEPFDLYELPIGMRAEGFEVGEKFARRWFNGRAYTAFARSQKTGDIVEGRYDADMIDADTVKLAWLFKNERIKEKYDDLLSRVHNNSAIREVRARFVRFLLNNPTFSGTLDTLNFHNGDLQDLHSYFEFQLSPVSTYDTAVNIGASGASVYAMSDVSASLGNFAFYAAVARATVNQDVYNRYTPNGTQYCRKAKVEITHIYAYARDSYSFHDAGSASQYLGHWNKSGVVIMPNAAAASMATKQLLDATSGRWDASIELGNQTYPPFPVDVVGKLLGRDVYYPVRNRDFQDWRTKKGRGGDFLIYSDRKLVKLDAPIFLDMGEICQ